MDRLTRIVVTDGTNLISDIAWSYDADQNVTAITTRVNNGGTLRTDTYAYSYDDDHRPTNTAYGSVSESITYDGYSRVTGKTVQNSGNTVLSTSYAYRDIDAQYTTTQVSSLTSSFGGNTLSHSYTYDANGNILSDGSTTYAYDSLNQLVWEYNTAAGKAWNYAYDLGGNILSKTEYDYADGQTSNPVTVSYTYGDAVWRDLLTAYNGEAITYDGIGNPTNYRGWGMTWQGGRQLSSMQKDGTTLSFSYNDAGLRTEKTVNGSTRRYIWNSSQLMADVGAADAFYFHYSSGGELIGYTYKTAEAETECILVKNQQGDVERVISTDGTILASYTYDAWGNVLTSEGTLAASNPIRYRGYYFDTETSLYYLQSRYYDPAVGRFINADGSVSTKRGINSGNMFAYCENDPVNKTDVDGKNPWIFLAGLALFVAVALCYNSAWNNKNDDTPYSGKANCYAYALKLEFDPDTGKAFRRKLQPGDLADIGLTLFDFFGTPSRVKTIIVGNTRADMGVLKYRCDEVYSADHVVRPGNWLIALAFSSNDKAFHWYRRDDDGTWSHKPGTDPISFWDESGNIITDPAACDRGLYDMFFGYYEIGPNTKE